jgi:hypothetical protein
LTCPARKIGVFDRREIVRPSRAAAHAGRPPLRDISPGERALLAELGRFSGLRVNVDDRPSHYGFGTHHVRVELVEARRPCAVPPSTRKTEAAAVAE